jgi:glycyl-tRNA synthetase beta subunit
LLAALTRLNGPVNAFFDETMIMADDETLRFRRLSLAYAAAQAYARAGDFTLLNPA